MREHIGTRRLYIKNLVYSSVVSLRIIFLTRRGLKKLTLNAFAFFGVLSAVVQFVSVAYSGSILIDHPVSFIVSCSVASILYGIFRTIPRSKICHTYSDIDITLNVVVGNILQKSGQIVVGFTDTFDTDITDSEVINKDSLQGKLLTEKFGGDQRALDRKLEQALRTKTIETLETRANKPKGKLQRYPIGTAVYVKSSAKDGVYALAISKMGNNLVAESSVHYLWESLGQLWECVYEKGQRKPASMPLLGTGLARINALDRESLLRMIILSFLARSREKLVCNELTVFIHPKDRHYINMLELEAFIKTI